MNTFEKRRRVTCPTWLPVVYFLALSATLFGCKATEPFHVATEHPADPNAPAGELSDAIALDSSIMIAEMPMHQSRGQLPGTSHMQGGQRDDGGHAHHQASEAALPMEAIAVLEGMLSAHDALRVLIRNADLEDATGRATEISQAVATLKEVHVPASPHFWHQQAGVLSAVSSKANQLAKSVTLEEGVLLAEALGEALNVMFEALQFQAKPAMQPQMDHSEHHHGGH